MLRLITLVVFLVGSVNPSGYTVIPISKDGIGEASICCPNDCKVEVIRTPIGLQMSPVCKVRASECKTVKGTPDEECWCQCMEDIQTYELNPVCFCVNMITDIEEDY